MSAKVKAAKPKKVKEKTPPAPWWRETTIYQVYPRSFRDSNGDGIGDIPGIISKLDYIRDLGFETVWLSPTYKSPQRDFGYDIADYRAMAPEYGTMKDAEKLIAETHKRGMKIVFDMILNHTSDEHPWFIESRSSRDNPKRDWYIWRDGRGNGPPNNWMAIPGGSGWEYDKKTDQWYFHNFMSFQPDLNFRNPAVKKAMFDTMKFWLDRGVDGFRLDIFHSIFKDDRFLDNPFSMKYLPNDEQTEQFFQKLTYTVNRPETFELAKDVRGLLNRYRPERFALGEVFGKDVVRRYLGENLDGLNLILLFELITMKKFTARSLRDIIEWYEKQYPAPMAPTYVLGNHDRRRVISRVDENVGFGKLLALFQFSVRGVPITYYGDEIGIPDGYFPHRGAKDSVAHPYWWLPRGLARFLGLYINRDGCRTPMQWDDSPDAGFTAGDAVPWLPVHRDYRRVNVKKQLADEYSLLNLYRNLLRLRRVSLPLRRGSMKLLDVPGAADTVLAYAREHEKKRAVAVMNVSDRPAAVAVPMECRRVLVKTDPGIIIREGKIELPALSGAVLE